MSYELRASIAGNPAGAPDNSDLVATLAIRSVFGTLGTAECGNGCWTFKRVGFWQSRASVRACGSDADLAMFTNSTWDRGGTLECADGRRFKATTSFWKSSFEFTTDADEPLVRFDYGGLFDRSATVTLAPHAAGLPHVSMLISFGWYLIVMLNAQAEMDAGAVVATM